MPLVTTGNPADGKKWLDVLRPEIQAGWQPEDSGENLRG
jgi:hypothetical protein